MKERRIILPNKMRIKQAKPQQAEVQVPIFPIPVRSKESFLMYALCAHATESGLYADMPEILSQLTTMRQGLEASYLKLAIPLYEYRQFVINKENACSPPNQATNLEEVLERANITWEALLNLVRQRVIEECLGEE